MRKVLFILFSISFLWTQAVTDTTLRFSGYTELYYGYSIPQRNNNSRPSFYYNHAKENQVALNIALLSFSVKRNFHRINTGVMIGDYALKNMASEPAHYRHLYEANVGFNLYKKWWIDFGIMPSHIGFESPIGKDSWTLSRSIVADNSPYYETGARLSYEHDKTIFVNIFALNGWQRIQGINGKSIPSSGLQFTYKPQSNITINYSGYYGYDTPDNNKLWRIYHNAYIICDSLDHWGFIANVDYGSQLISANSTSFFSWSSAQIIAKYYLNRRMRFVARLECFKDPHGFAVVNQNPYVISGKNVLYGASTNYDLLYTDKILLRIEYKHLYATEPYFRTAQNSYRLHDNMITAAVCAWF